MSAHFICKKLLSLHLLNALGGFCPDTASLGSLRDTNPDFVSMGHKSEAPFCNLEHYASLNDCLESPPTAVFVHLRRVSRSQHLV